MAIFDQPATISMETLYERLDAWGFWKTGAVMLVTYAASWLLLSSVFARPGEQLFVYLILALFMGSLIFASTLIIRTTLKWHVHAISMGLLAALAQIAGLGIAGFIALAVDGDSMYLWLMLPFSLGLFLAGYAQLRKAGSEQETLPYWLRIYAGAIAVAFLCRIFDPRSFSPQDLEDFGILAVQIPIMLLTAVFFLRGRFAGPAGAVIWPLIAFIAIAFSAIMDENLSDANQGGKIVLTILGVGAVLAIGFAMHHLSRIRRSIVGAIMAVPAIIDEEATGGPLVKNLDYRLQWILLDIAYGVLIGVMFSRIISDSGVEVSWLVRVFSGFGYIYTGAFLILSLLMRLFAKRRFRFTHMAMAFVPTMFILGGIVSALLLPLLDDPIKAGLPIVRMIVAAILLIAAPAAVLYAIRRAVFDWTDIRIAGLFVGGAIVADLLFTFFVGESASERFKIGIAVGDIAALAIVLSAGFVFWRHRMEPAGFIVWPAAAIAGGLLLRILVNAQGSFNTFDARIQTGWAEIIICAIVGAAVGELAVLAKRVWWDKDPDARTRAVRVRGGAMIVYAVWPVFVLFFVITSVTAFTNDITDEIDEIATETQGFQDQATRLAAAVSTASTELGDQITILEKEIVNMRERVKDEANRIPHELQAIAADAAEAGKRVAAEAQRQGEAFVDETVGAVKEGLADAFTIPPLDLGFLGSIEFPDLGIGDAIGNMLSGLFDFELGFDAMLEQFVNTMTQSITAEFEGPMQRAEEIAARMEGHAQFVSDAVQSQANFVKTKAEELQTLAKVEYADALERAKRMLVQVVYIGYHLIVLLAMLVLAALAWLAWRALQGLIVMISRVTEGWKMLTTGEEPLTLTDLVERLEARKSGGGQGGNPGGSTEPGPT